MLVVQLVSCSMFSCFLFVLFSCLGVFRFLFVVNCVRCFVFACLAVYSWFSYSGVSVCLFVSSVLVVFSCLAV